MEWGIDEFCDDWCGLVIAAEDVYEVLPAVGVPDGVVDQEQEAGKMMVVFLSLRLLGLVDTVPDATSRGIKVRKLYAVVYLR